MVLGNTVVEAVGSPEENDAAVKLRVEGLGVGSFMKIVGRGGMGTIVLLQGFPDVAGPVVVKIMRQKLFRDAEAVRRFRSELTMHHRLWAELQTPRLVPSLAVGDTGETGGMFGVFPFYSNGSLEEAANTQPLEVSLRCLADATEGLGALHGHGYIHRDVCLKNIFVALEGGVERGRLGDLGVAVPLEGNALISETFVERELSFTVGHLGYIDPWYPGTKLADLFGVGASLYALLTSLNPPQTVAPNGLQLPGRANCRPGVGRDLYRSAQAVLTRLTAKDSSIRYSTASEVAAAIQRLATTHLAETKMTLRQKLHTTALMTAVAGSLIVLGVLLVLHSRVKRPKSEPLLTHVSKQGTILETGARSSPAPAANDAEPTGTKKIVKTGEGAGGQAFEMSHGVATLVEHASDKIRSKDFIGAERLLHQALTDSPGNPEATSLLALILSREPSGREQAAHFLAEALKQHPNRGDLRVQLSRLRASTGDLQAAIQLLDKAPAGTSRREDIARWRVTLERLRHRSQ